MITREEQIEIILAEFSDKIVEFTKLSIEDLNKIQEYKTPRRDYILVNQQGKAINELRLSTLEYIMFKAVEATEDEKVDALFAYLYYYKYKKKLHRLPDKMKDVVNSVIEHYTIVNKQDKYCYKYLGSVLYLVNIKIGKYRSLYKVGISDDIDTRLTRLRSDIMSNYCVSVSVEPLNVWIVSNNKKLEKEVLEKILDVVKYDSGFKFKGSEESFIIELDELLEIVEPVMKGYKQLTPTIITS